MRYVLFLCLFLVACSGVAFEAPDIKDDFCGVHMNYQYCKCAFHNDYCDAIGMEKADARAYVYGAYDAWVDELFEDFSALCVRSGGFIEKETCYTCDEGYIMQNKECVLADDMLQDVDSSFDDASCPTKESFVTDWRKYSDIDSAIPYSERSYEAKQVTTYTDELIDEMIAAFALEYDIVIEEQVLADAREYQTALTQNLKTNLLKAFFRLSWVTYSTINSGRSAGASYSSVVNSGASVETIGSGLKVVQSVIPQDSQLVINTSSNIGKAKAIGASVALEAIDTLGDPVAVATELFKASANAPLPSADITPEEIEILKDQHLRSGLLEESIATSEARVFQMKKDLAKHEQEIARLQKEIASWEEKEQSRVRLLLEDECPELS